MIKFDATKILKWLPVAAAGAAAIVQAIGDQKQQDRIDELDERIAELENEEES